MPVWGAIIVGLGSGLGSSIIGTLLTVSHERAAEFRSRMLLAAEDFLRRAEAVRRFARRPHSTAASEPLEVLLDAWDDLVSAAVLIELLFRHGSEAAHWARETVNELSDVAAELRAIEAHSDPYELVRKQRIEEHMSRAGDAMDRFGQVAPTQVRRYGSWLPRRGFKREFPAPR